MRKRWRVVGGSVKAVFALYQRAAERVNAPGGVGYVEAMAEFEGMAAAVEGAAEAEAAAAVEEMEAEAEAEAEAVN